MNDVPFDFIDRVICIVPKNREYHLHQISAVPGPWSRTYEATWECELRLTPTHYTISCFRARTSLSSDCKCCPEHYLFSVHDLSHCWNTRTCAISLITLERFCNSCSEILDASALEKMKRMIRANKSLIDVMEVRSADANLIVPADLLKEVRGFGIVSINTIGSLSPVVSSILSQPIGRCFRANNLPHKWIKVLRNAVVEGRVTEFELNQQHLPTAAEESEYVELMRSVLSMHADRPPQVIFVYNDGYHEELRSLLVDYKRTYNFELTRGEFTQQKTLEYKR